MREVSTLTITVKGKAQYFKKGEAFVAAAPEIVGWEIIALEEPVPGHFLLEELIVELCVRPQGLYFSFDNDNTEYADITVYHPLCTKENENLFYRLADGAVYNLLGERLFGMNIHYTDVANLSCAGSSEVFKLEYLPVMMGSLKSSMIVSTYDPWL